MLAYIIYGIYQQINYKSECYVKSYKYHMENLSEYMIVRVEYVNFYGNYKHKTKKIEIKNRIHKRILSEAVQISFNHNRPLADIYLCNWG